MKRSKTKYYLLISLLFFFTPQTVKSKDKPQIDLNHWWASTSELSALNVIAETFEKRGGIFESIQVDRNDYVSDVVEQSSLGYFPGASHWQGGQETVVLKNRGILSFIPNQLDGKDLSSLLHKEVYRDITNEGDIMSLPLGLHLQNMAYYNKKIYDQLKLKPPTSWPEFIEQAKIIKKAGYTPLALSQIRWQMRNILDSIMIGLKGAEFFKHIYDYKRPVDSLREDLIEVYELFLSLRQFTEKKHAKYKWFENINALANGEIAAYFLGDYSTGEFVTKEKLVPNKDFYCRIAPGNQGVQVYGIDTFILFKSKNEAVRRGQELLIQSVLDPQVQADYIAMKGGIPVRRDVTLSSLDECSKTIYEEWLSPETQRLPYPAGHGKARLSVLQTTAIELWQQEKPDVPAAVDKIIAAFPHLLQ